MTRTTLSLLAALLLVACANPGASNMAPTGIRAANGGGERTVGNVGTSGTLSTTTVR